LGAFSSGTPPSKGGTITRRKTEAHGHVWQVKPKGVAQRKGIFLALVRAEKRKKRRNTIATAALPRRRTLWEKKRSSLGRPIDIRSEKDVRPLLGIYGWRRKGNVEQSSPRGARGRKGRRAGPSFKRWMMKERLAFTGSRPRWRNGVCLICKKGTNTSLKRKASKGKTQSGYARSGVGAGVLAPKETSSEGMYKKNLCQVPKRISRGKSDIKGNYGKTLREEIDDYQSWCFDENHKKKSIPQEDNQSIVAEKEEKSADRTNYLLRNP